MPTSTTSQIIGSIGWIKDLFTIVFSGAATIIAILTYRKARETFLQPVRTEVIKKQTDLLTDLLETLKGKEIDTSLDYIGLVHLNAIKWLQIYGFILRPESIGKLDEGSDSLIFAEGIDVLEDFELLQTFPSEKKEVIDHNKKRYENALKGIFRVDRIFLTQKYSVFIKKLRDYLDNPFLPTKTRNILLKIIQDSDANLKIHLVTILTAFIKEMFERRQKNNGQTTPFDTAGLFNEFNHAKVAHRQDYELLKQEVRDYLKVDSVL